MTLIVGHNNIAQSIEQAKIKEADYLSRVRAAETLAYRGFPVHPSDYACAYLTNAVYDEDFGEKSLLPGWQLIYSGKDNESGYEGAAYWHQEHRHLVIAHRGTDGGDKKDIKMDAASIVRGHVGAQMVAAKTFVLDTLMKFRTAGPVSITMTGHSLGGWLAQVATFHVEEMATANNNKTFSMRARAVVFDSPGCERMLEDISANHERVVNLQQLDITTYLSAPNLINTANSHLGTLYQCRFNFQPSKGWNMKDFIFNPKTLGLKDLIRYTEETHSMAEILASFNKEQGRFKEVKRMRAWPLTTWQDGNKRSLTALQIMGVLKDYLTKTDSRQLASFNQLAEQMRTTHLTEGELIAEQAYQLKYDAQYYPVEEVQEAENGSYVIKTAAFHPATITFLARYLEVNQAVGERGVQALHGKFIEKGLTQLPQLLKKLTLEEIPNSSAKFLRSPRSAELAHYLWHTQLLYPSFFHQGFELFAALLQEVKNTTPSTETITASLVGKAKYLQVASVHDKGVVVPDTIAPALFDTLMTKYFSQIEAASKIPLVGEVTERAEIGPVERTKLHMYDSKQMVAKTSSSSSSSQNNSQQIIGEIIIIEGAKVTLNVAEIPLDKKIDVFKLMEAYADNCQRDEQIKKNRKGEIVELDLENKPVTDMLVKSLCKLLNFQSPSEVPETKEKKTLGSNLQ